MVVLFISHVHLLREAVLAVLNKAEGIEAFAAFSRDTAEAAALEFAPSLVLVDASHPEGATLVAAVQARVATTRVIVLDTREWDDDLLTWARIGVSGYLASGTSALELIATVHCVEAGETVYPPKLIAVLMSLLAGRAHDRSIRAGIHALTRREREIAALLAEGLPNKLIAHRLGIALATAKNHVHSIFDKWDVRSRGQVADCYRQKTQEESQACLPCPTVRPWSNAWALSASESTRPALRPLGGRHVAGLAEDHVHQRPSGQWRDTDSTSGRAPSDPFRPYTSFSLPCCAGAADPRPGRG